METDHRYTRVTNSKKHFIITLQHINSLGQICAFWQLGATAPHRLLPSFTLHCSWVALAPRPVGEAGEKGPAAQSRSPPSAGLHLSSAGVTASVEGPLLRGQASKEGVQQGLRQCDALGRVEL
jgi:hypothetical protein